TSWAGRPRPLGSWGPRASSRRRRRRSRGLAGSAGSAPDPRGRQPGPCPGPERTATGRDPGPERRQPGACPGPERTESSGFRGWNRVATACSAAGGGAEAAAPPNRWVGEVRLGVLARLVPFTLAAFLVAGTLGAASARAETYRVTRHDDPRPGSCKRKDCSLREAIRAANRNPGPDVVVLPDRR